MTACTTFVKRVLADFIKREGHDYATIQQLRILSAKPGLVRASLAIEKRNLNRIGSLHGGLICTLVDTMGSLALSSRGMFMTGVSTDIHTTFIRNAGGEGSTVIAEGVVDSMGKTLAFTSVRLLHPDTNKLLAHGTHTKYIVDALKSDQNVAFDDSGEHESTSRSR